MLLLFSERVLPDSSTAIQVVPDTTTGTDYNTTTDNNGNNDNHVTDGNDVVPIIPVQSFLSGTSLTSLASFKSALSRDEPRRSPRKASKPRGWYSELHNFGKEY